VVEDPNWQDIKINPSSFASRASDALGNSIDWMSDKLVRALDAFGNVFVTLTYIVADKIHRRRK
jgi:hypothetical protein